MCGVIGFTIGFMSGGLFGVFLIAMLIAGKDDK